MKNVRIIGTGSYLPDNIVSNDDLSSFVETSDEWISSRTGIKNRRITTGEGTTDLAVNAAKKAVESSKINPSEIDLILVATISADNFTPSTACEVQKEIEADNAMCFDINAACSGFIFALNTATAYIKAGLAKNALVIGVEVLSRLTDWEDRRTCVLFGDGSGAVVISESEEEGIIDFECKSLGKLSEYLVCGGSDLKNPYVNKETHKYIKMNGQEVFKFACSYVPKGIKNVIEESPYNIEDIDYFVLHQANERIINSIAKRLKIDQEKIYKNISSYGNTSSASVPIALDEMFKKNILKKGNRIIIAGFGGGLTYGVAMITI
ncbi:beta-ketoacyl-ACP synthase III [Vallitalea guaymasensis]|uniref:beta-ketoacyl-ACP synthase III n=1 Tax=Vallitalea guaymasensis TaxID=1185412 RepID=UPI00235663DC|nr:beta-ketoacyl-ACP synthase III [Vallitalea guaymasensis]